MLTDPEGPLIYISLFILLLTSFFFAGSESAYSSCNRHKMLVLEDDGNKRAKLVLRILDHFDTALITDLIAVNICEVVISVLSTVICIGLFGNSGSLVSTLLTTIIVFFFCEVLPKNIATVNADKWALFFCHFFYLFIILIYPITIIFKLILKLTKRVFNMEEDEDVFDEDDFQNVIEKAEDEEILDEEESDIIQAAIEFGDIKAKEVYTKREFIVALDIKDCTKENLLKLFIENTYTRFPIYDGTIDNIIGILHLRTYVRNCMVDENYDIKDSLVQPVYVTSGSRIDNILERMKKAKTQVAIVTKNDIVTGMITMKDILEELVEDIDDIKDDMRGEHNA